MKSVFFVAAFLTNAKLVLSLSCPSPFTAVGTSGCYYILPESKIDWYTAYTNCKLDYNGYLVEINDAQEQANIAAFLKRSDPSNTLYYWIGGSDIQKEGSYRWMTSGNYVTYAAWDAGQPDNIGNSEDCLHLWFRNNEYFWNDNVCAATESFKALCEADPLRPCNKPTIPCKEPEIPCEQTYD